ncbi:MAG: hypothetical protein RL676_354 [Pseudomonadota bacterium]|jgi:16S rRNA (guanine527-N7)-methyltransferase
MVAPESAEAFFTLISDGWHPPADDYRLSDEQIQHLCSFLLQLNRWNQVHSLTAILDPEQQVIRHILDALAVWPQIDRRLRASRLGNRVADVGSGMGVPGVVLAIVMPEFEFHLIERQQKKASFLRHVAARLGHAVQIRVVDQDVTRMRVDEGYDLIVCRAFSGLHEFLSLTHHLSKPGTLWAAMTGRDKKSEESLSKMIIKNNHLEIEPAVPIEVKGLMADRHLVWVKRTS